MNLREEEEEELYCRRLLQVAKRQVLHAYIQTGRQNMHSESSAERSPKGYACHHRIRLLGPFIAILVVSSADAQLSLSLGQHNTDQADVVRGLIKISAHISIYTLNISCGVL